ncbi:MAG: 50S ribosomal protein L3 [Coprobacillus sp.]|nr:50S ribosomal protein L3 [Coprobacillus sp.]
MKAIIGRKVGMTEVFAEDGTMYPVTVVEVLPNVVTQVKTIEKDGYAAIQVGYEDKKESRANKPEKGIAAKANTVPHQFLRELRADEMLNYQVGDKITVDIFKAGDIVDVIGTSKGKGFEGAIKRWHQKIGPKGHGSGYHRGSGTFANNGRTNNRVLPGKHMPGHGGHKSATILNLQVIQVIPEKNAILIKGGIPGPNKSVVQIRTAIKTQLKKKTLKPLIVRNVEETIVEEEVVETPTQETLVEETIIETPTEETPVEENPVTEETPNESTSEEIPEVDTPEEAHTITVDTPEESSPDIEIEVPNIPQE